MGYLDKVYHFGDVTFMTLHNLHVCLCSHCLLLVCEGFQLRVLEV